jgi:amidase
MTDLPFRSASALARMIREGEVGCRDLLEIYAGRVDRYNPRLNAIVWTDLDGARARADAADAALKKGEVWGPLHGVPMTIKESYDVVGMPTTWGVPALKDNVPPANAIVVERMLAAGVVLFGKTNVPLQLADWQSFNEIYGTTNNPWDVGRTPGGSSGGSAAALAAGLTAIEAGSDIGASIRNPAHYCGVFGHKPTYGIVPPRGQALPGRVAESDISVVGPMARSADDLEVALLAMAGPDEVTGVGLRLELPRPRKTRPSELRVAVLLSVPSAEVDAEVQEKIQAVGEFFARQGATVSDRARPDFDTTHAHRVFIQLLRAATSGRQTQAEFEKNQKRVKALAPDDVGYRAQMLRANTMAHRDWLAWNEERHRMRLAWAAFFRDWDLLICPAAASTAFLHNHKGERWERMIAVNGQPQPSTEQMFWAGYSGIAFMPSTVAPAGRGGDGLPIGVQIIGGQYRDLECIHLARLIEREHYGFVPPPGFD